MMRWFLFSLLFVSVQLHAQSEQQHFTADFFEKQAFSHRGGYAYGPENTIETILYNLQFGVRAFEVDVMLTKDNQLVLFHDDSIHRVLNTTDKKRVDELTLDELKGYNLRDERLGTTVISTLQELFDTLLITLSEEALNDFILELDFKPHGPSTANGVAQLLEVVKREVDNHGNKVYNYFFISSFYPKVLKEIREGNNEVKTALALSNSVDNRKLAAKWVVFAASRIIKKHGVSIVEPSVCMISPQFVRKYHKKGVLINAWTANTRCEKEYLSNFTIAHTTNCPYDVCENEPSVQSGKPRKWCKKCR